RAINSGLGMKASAFEKVAVGFLRGRDRLPLEFCWQPHPRPASKRVRFIIADMASGLGVGQAPESAESRNPPRSCGLLPVERCFPAMSLDGVPTVREPEFRLIIAAIRDELGVFTTRHRPRAQLERL